MRVCEIEDCNNKYKAKGYCRIHYYRMRRHGDPTICLITMDHCDICKIEGCNKKYFAKGYCRKHYRRAHVHGDPNIVLREYRLPKGHAARNEVISNYKGSAKARNLEWALELEDCETLFKSNCHYCGREPSRVYSTNTCNGSYTYNGIDRAYNNKGYTLDNVVPCCTECNFLKMSRDIDEFITHAKRIASHSV